MRTILTSTVAALLLLAMIAAKPGTTAAQQPAAAEGTEAPKKVDGLNPDRAVPPSIPTWWKSPAKPSLDVKEVMLENGLRILALKHGNLPIVTTYAYYDVGSKDEAPGQTGLAHFLEHMMFKGSTKWATGDIDKANVRHGGSNNASTDYDRTEYHFSMPASAWTIALDMEADRMAALTLDAKEFDSERKPVQEEYNRDYDNPEEAVNDDIMRAIFAEGHPYAHSVLGYAKDVAAMTVDEMRRFHDANYTPDNCTVIVAGGIDPEEAIKEVKARFGKIPRGRFAPRWRPNAPETASSSVLQPARAVRRIERIGQVPTPKLIITLPSDQTMSIRGPCRDVLASVLTEGETSRLVKRLVLAQPQLCTSVGAYERNMRLGGLFTVECTLAAINLPGDEPTDPKALAERRAKTESLMAERRAKVEAAVFEEIAKLAKEPPSEAEVKRAIRSHEVSDVFSRESAANIAAQLGEYQISYRDWKFIDKYLETVRAVQPDDVRQVADDWNMSRDPVIAWLLPKDRLTGDRSAVVIPEMPELAVQESALPNGLRLLMLPQDKGPDVFTLSLRYEAGARTQPADKTGLVDLLSATMETGTATRSRAQIQETFADLGGSFSARASGVSASVLARDWKIAVDVAADVAQNATFPEKEVEHEKTQLLSEMEAYKDDHASLCSRAFNAAVYGKDHPFARQTPNDPKVVAAITHADLLAHYRKWVTPNNAKLIVTGRFDAAAVKKAVEEAFDGWKAGTDSVKPYAGALPAGPREGMQTFTNDKFIESAVDAKKSLILIDDEEKGQCHIRIGRAAIKRDNPDYYAVMVLDNILGTSPGFTDRYSHYLRDMLGLAYTVSANVASRSSEEPGAFVGYCGSDPTKVPTAMQGMVEILRDIQANPISDADLENAKGYLTGSVLFDIESSSGQAGLIFTIDRYKLGWDYLQTFAKKIAGVTKEDVMRVAKQYLGPEGLVTVISGPLAKIPGGDELFATWNAATFKVPEDGGVLGAAREREAAGEVVPVPTGAH